MNLAYLLIGGNLGNRQENLGKTRGIIEKQCGAVSRVSSVYETSAWGKTDQPDFLNQALLIRTLLEAPVLLRTILDIEQQMGRFRTEKYGPRIIDIDIILFNNDVIELPNLRVPHPYMQHRRFVLAPLAEIAPSLIHPVLKKSISQLLEECPDPLPVDKKS